MSVICNLLCTVLCYTLNTIHHIYYKYLYCAVKQYKLYTVLIIIIIIIIISYNTFNNNFHHNNFHKF